MTHIFTLYGVPGVIQKMMTASWLPCSDNTLGHRNYFFDGLLFFSDKIYLVREYDNQAHCTVRVSLNGASFLLFGFLEPHVAHTLQNGGLCLLGHRRRMELTSDDKRTVRTCEVREPFTTAPDGRHTELYTFEFTFDPVVG